MDLGITLCFSPWPCLDVLSYNLPLIMRLLTLICHLSYYLLVFFKVLQLRSQLWRAFPNFHWQREKTVKIKINGNQYNKDIEILAHLPLSSTQGSLSGSKKKKQDVLETVKFAKWGVLSLQVSGPGYGSLALSQCLALCELQGISPELSFI